MLLFSIMLAGRDTPWASPASTSKRDLVLQFKARRGGQGPGRGHARPFSLSTLRRVVPGAPGLAFLRSGGDCDWNKPDVTEQKLERDI